MEQARLQGTLSSPCFLLAGTLEDSGELTAQCALQQLFLCLVSKCERTGLKADFVFSIFWLLKQSAIFQIVTILPVCSAGLLVRRNYSTEEPGGATRELEPAVLGEYKHTTEWWLRGTNMAGKAGGRPNDEEKRKQTEKR